MNARRCGRLGSTYGSNSIRNALRPFFPLLPVLLALDPALLPLLADEPPHAASRRALPLAARNARRLREEEDMAPILPRRRSGCPVVCSSRATVSRSRST